MDRHRLEVSDAEKESTEAETQHEGCLPDHRAPVHHDPDPSQGVDRVAQNLFQKFQESQKSQASEPKPGDVDLSQNPSLKMISDSIESGFVDAGHGGAGRAFMRAHPKGSKQYEDYQKSGSRAAKALKRLNWAKQFVVTEMSKSRTHEASYKTVDTTLGEYVVFG